MSLERLHRKYSTNMAALLAGRANINWRDMLKMGVGVAFDGQETSRDVKPQGGPATLEWSVQDGKGLYVAKGDAGVLVGHTSRFGRVTDDVRITNPSYAVLTITSLDGMFVWNGKKVLITACGRCENTGMKFSKDRQTVGRNWGGAPVRIEAVTGMVNLPTGQWKCQALGPDGTAKCEVPIINSAIKLSPEYGTMWYLLTQ